MTVQEYIDNNLPFYHITNMGSLDSVLQEGLLRSRRSGARFGICVVRSDADDIISEIIDCQLQEDGTELYALISLFPEKHNISAADISRDPINEAIGPMCNYIIKEPILIGEEDIIKRNIPVGLYRERRTVIETLTNYQGAIPPING